MANLIFPSESTRRIVSVAGAQTPILSTAGQTATVYSDSAGTTLASITTYPGNAVVTGSQLTLDAYGRLPFFYGPDTTTKTLYVKVGSGAVWPLTYRCAGTVDPSTVNEPWVDSSATSGAADTLKTTAASGSALTLDFTQGTVQDVTLTAATVTLTISGATAGTPASMTVLLRQDATGSRVISWPAAIKWAAGTPPTLSTAASKVDVVSLITNDGGTTIYGFLGGTDFR